MNVKANVGGFNVSVNDAFGVHVMESAGNAAGYLEPSVVERVLQIEFLVDKERLVPFQLFAPFLDSLGQRPVEPFQEEKEAVVMTTGGVRGRSTVGPAPERHNVGVVLERRQIITLPHQTRTGRLEFGPVLEKFGTNVLYHHTSLVLDTVSRQINQLFLSGFVPVVLLVVVILLLELNSIDFKHMRESSAAKNTSEHQFLSLKAREFRDCALLQMRRRR